ncbi:predicted protein, partial [Haematococcus lacustris]
MYLGLDFGTSGARATVIDEDGGVQADVRQLYGADAAKDWTGAWS